MGSVWLYGRVLGGVLAAVGLFVIVGLQIGWIGVVLRSELPVDADMMAQDNAATEDTTIKVTGPKVLFSRDMIAVDTARTYRLDADVYVLPGKDGSSQASVVYFGVSTYDSKGKELRSGPGTYRYAGALGRSVSSNEGWVHLRGTITGEGDKSHKQFRPGTSAIKLVLIGNYRSKDEPEMLVRNVEFSKLISLVP